MLIQSWCTNTNSFVNRYSNEKKLSSSGPGQVKVMRRSDEVQEGQRKDIDLSYTIFWFFK